MNNADDILNGPSSNAANNFLPEFPLAVGNSPFNVKLLDLRTKNLALIKPVTSLDIFDGATTNFHEDGLYSISIFGRVGTEERTRRMSYIDLHTEVLHPIVFAAIGKMRKYYLDIMAGKAYGIWNEETKLIDRATELDGETGYAFFMRCWPKLELPKGKSGSRNINIELFERYRGKGDLVRYMPVSPAGLRDVMIDEQERVTKDEVNDFYYRILSIANTIVPDADTAKVRVYDTARWSLQLSVNAVYDHYESMCKGKGGLFQRGWGGRNVFNGTRNVITAMNTSTPDLDSPRSPSPISTQIGLYQLLKGCLPVAKHHIRTGWLSNVFVEGQAGAYLVNPKTLKRELVDVDISSTDRWTTDEGLDKVINGFSKPESRQKPILVENYYIGLIYVDDNSFKIFGDIDELPQGLDRNRVSPLTYTQLLYLSGYKVWNTLVTMLTRYPVTGLGSTYTSYVYCRTTIVASQKFERDWDWSVNTEGNGALEFPDQALDAPFVDSLIPHTVYLSGLSADFDGDTASANILYGDLSLKENEAYFNTTNAYLDQNGEFSITPDVHTVNLVLHNMTGFQ